MKKLELISASEAITGYVDSKIAKVESNDCVVRSIASASGLSYDKAHSFVADKFKRVPRKGTHGFISTMNSMCEKNLKINRKDIKTVDVVIRTKNSFKTMTVNKFVENYPSGSYIVVVKGHAFTIKDSKVIGNFNDAIQTKKKVISAWKVGKK